jgi:hypothetical protein
MTPEFDPIAAHNALAPPHWDAEEFDFWAPWSEDDMSLTDGEDLSGFLDEELEDDASDWSWEPEEEDEEEEEDDDDDGADDEDGDEDDDDEFGDDELSNDDVDDDDDGCDDDCGGDDGSDSDGGGGSWPDKRRQTHGPCGCYWWKKARHW